ncbi:hypothetical protein [Aeromonas phage PZL-Ah152]|uniref:Uncharacterized protein n=1 Tax=Aeromonas phage PZL-Ah152 TaxID=2820393 RepID=A0A8A6C5Y0_9CAUD|nr:hypothetical protein [Aeromonas phage PZL-Ah152]
MNKVIAVAMASGIMLMSSAVEAKGFSMSRPSFSRPSISRPITVSKPAPRPVVKQTTVKKTTVIQQNNTVVNKSGGGFMSSLAGSLGGTMLGNWLFHSSGNSDEQAQPVEQFVCPENMVCESKQAE